MRKHIPGFWQRNPKLLLSTKSTEKISSNRSYAILNKFPYKVKKKKKKSQHEQLTISFNLHNPKIYYSILQIKKRKFRQ